MRPRRSSGAGGRSANRWCGSWRLYRPDGSPMSPGECALALTLKRRVLLRGVEAIAERPNGERVLFLAEPTLLFDADGALAGAVNLLTDLSGRKWNTMTRSAWPRSFRHRKTGSSARI